MVENIAKISFKDAVKEHLSRDALSLKDVQRAAILAALELCKWSQKDAAELLKISPRVMNYKIMTLGLRQEVRGKRFLSPDFAKANTQRSLAPTEVADEQTASTSVEPPAITDPT